MKNRWKCKVFSMCLSLILFAAFPLELFASTVSEQGEVEPSNRSVPEYETVLLNVSGAEGSSAQNTDDLFAGDGRVFFDSKLLDLVISYRGKELVLRSDLEHRGRRTGLDSVGVIYKNVGTETEKAYENILLAEMEDSGNIRFVQLRIDREYKKILLTLQEKDSFTLMYFEIPITDAVFDDFGEAVQNKLAGENLEEKMRELYIINRNILNRKEDSTSSGGGGGGDFPWLVIEDKDASSGAGGGGGGEFPLLLTQDEIDLSTGGSGGGGGGVSAPPPQKSGI
ncbi:MAG: hypothetical protein Q3993_04590 [Filifactor alocis]|nr:hypothetical protein [Filifactor alocis]